MSYTAWDQTPLLVNPDVTSANIGASYIYGQKKNLWILWFLLGFFLLVGGGLITGAFVGSGYNPNSNVVLFWGLTGPAIACFNFALFFLMFAPFQHCHVNAKIKAFNHWQQSPMTISWSAGEFTNGLWQQFVDEEYGPTGRATIRYDWKKWAEILLYWAFLTVVCSGVAAIRMALDGKVASIGGIPWIAFCIILGASLGTLTTVLVFCIPEIVLFFAKRDHEQGPQAFVASPEGIYWMGTFYDLDPANRGCCSALITLEHRRLNNYQMRLSPCLEFCFSSMVKNGKRYSFVRIPVPPNKLEEAAAFVNGAFAQPGTNATVWTNLKSYAKDLEDSGPIQQINFVAEPHNRAMISDF